MCTLVTCCTNNVAMASFCCIAAPDPGQHNMSYKLKEEVSLRTQTLPWEARPTKRQVLSEKLFDGP